MQIKNLTYTSLFAALTAIGAFISIPIPFSPIPLSLQITFTATAGYVLGPKYGLISQAIYLLLGAIGLPVFANRTGGFATLFGPTSGYLWGFLIGAWLIGILGSRQNSKDLKTIILVMLSGLLVMYGLGMIGMILTLQYNLKQAFLAGVLPFILLDIVKIIIAALLTKKIGKVYS